jgi:HSP20 family protein
MKYYMVPGRTARPHMVRNVEFNGGRRIPVDVHADSDEFVITAMVPGLTADDLEVEILDDVVSLRAEIKPEENGDGEYLLRERAFGRFARSLRLPDPVDASKVDASVENGLLKLRIPKAEEAKPKKISIKAN